MADLTPAERALFTRRRKEIYEALHPETRQGGVGRAGYEKGANLASFSADTAARTGRSERDIQRDATRGERIDGDDPRPAPVIRKTRASKGAASCGLICGL